MRAVSAPEADDEGLLWQGLDPGAPRRLAAAGLDCFAERGFHATTTRDIAARAGLSPAAVYVHYPSKGELLYRVSLAGHMAALRVLEQAAGDEQDPRERVRLVVSAFASWHARHHRMARVVQYELAALPARRRRQILAMRQRFETQVEDELERGVAAGCFDVPEVPGAALAVLSLCIDRHLPAQPLPDRGAGDGAGRHAGVRRPLRRGARRWRTERGRCGEGEVVERRGAEPRDRRVAVDERVPLCTWCDDRPGRRG